MTVTTAIRRLTLTEANAHVSEGGAYLDLRPVDDYLDVHIAGSFGLVYERGPGLPSRARDCLPLAVPFVLLEDRTSDLSAVAAALRGKGFTVLGYLPGGVRAWAETLGTPASTERSEESVVPQGLLLDVGERGAPRPDGSVPIAIDDLAERSDELPSDERIVICAGRGLRAALAVGLLERSGRSELLFWSPSPTRKTYGKRGVVTVEPARR